MSDDNIVDLSTKKTLNADELTMTPDEKLTAKIDSLLEEGKNLNLRMVMIAGIDKEGKITYAFEGMDSVNEVIGLAETIKLNLFQDFNETAKIVDQ